MWHLQKIFMLQAPFKFQTHGRKWRIVGKLTIIGHLRKAAGFIPGNRAINKLPTVVLLCCHVALFIHTALHEPSKTGSPDANGPENKLAK